MHEPVVVVVDGVAVVGVVEVALEREEEEAVRRARLQRLQLAFSSWWGKI